jgi:hypothetical protein
MAVAIDDTSSSSGGGTTATLSNRLSTAFATCWKLFTYVVCGICWAWLAFRLALKPFPFRFVPSAFEPYQPRLLFSLSIAAIVFVLVLWRPWATLKHSFWFGVRLAFFPLIITFWVLLLPVRLVRFVYRTVNRCLGIFIRTTLVKACVLTLGLLGISLATAVFFGDLRLKAIGLIACALAVVTLMRIAFLWTARPMLMLDQALTTIFRLGELWHKVLQKNVDTTRSSKTPDETAKSLKSLKDGVDQTRSMIRWAEKVVDANTNRRFAIKSFLWVFALCVSGMIITFAVGFNHVEALWPNSFADGLANEPLNYLYRSQLVISTSGEVHPTSYAARVAVMVEILCGIGLLSLLIVQFSIVVLPEIDESRQSLTARLRQKLADTDAFEQQAIEALNVKLGVVDATVVDTQNVPPSS